VEQFLLRSLQSLISLKPFPPLVKPDDLVPWWKLDAIGSNTLNYLVKSIHITFHYNFMNHIQPLSIKILDWFVTSAQDNSGKRCFKDVLTDSVSELYRQSCIILSLKPGSFKESVTLRLTNSTEPSPSRDAARTSQHFMEQEVSLLRSQVPSSGP
jgi:hypothetical protein